MTLLELMNTLWSSNMAMEHPLKIEASYGIIEKWWVFHYRRAYHIALNYTHTVLCYLILLYINFPIFEKLKLGLVQCYTQVGEREREIQSLNHLSVHQFALPSMNYNNSPLL